MLRFLAVVAGFALLVCLPLLVYRPDRPVATIVPGSSSRPAFVVQIIRPRLGLPLGGILPPSLFGLEDHLGFDTGSTAASADFVSARRLELGADGWELVIVLDAKGHVAPGTEVVFELVFEEQRRRVRCRPDDPAHGTLHVTAIGPGELSGRFDIELAHCEDADTGELLRWPPEPFVLHGSFDRLPLTTGSGEE